MGPLNPSDVIPPLRHNLHFSADGQGLGDELLSVTNLTSGEELRLRGFEVSIARLLDGHRTAREVVEAAQRVGLPLTLSGLEGFVNRLAVVDLVGEEDEGTPFDPRDAWEDATRTGYRTALREARTGHLRASAAALDRVIEREPWSIEAVKLRGRLMDRDLPSFPRLFAEAQRRWLAMLDDVPLRLGPPRAALWFGFGAAMLALLAAAFVPLPHTVNAPAVMLPMSTARVTAARTAPIDTVAVRLGQRVAEGDLLFTYDASSTVVALEAAQARVAQQRAELLAVGPAEQAETLHRLEAEVAQLEEQLHGVEVRAPQAGEVTHLAARPGETLREGSDAAQIDETRILKVVAAIAPDDLDGVLPGRPAELVAQNHTVPASITRVEGGRAIIEIDNAAGVLTPGAGELQIRARPRPLLPVGFQGR